MPPCQEGASQIATFTGGISEATIRLMRPGPLTQDDADASNPSFASAFREAITAAEMSVNELARRWEGQGATDRQVKNRAGTLRRWLSGAVQSPSRVHVRKAEKLLDVGEGALERHVDRSRGGLRDIRREIADLREIVDRLVRQLEK